MQISAARRLCRSWHCSPKPRPHSTPGRVDLPWPQSLTHARQPSTGLGAEAAAEERTAADTGHRCRVSEQTVQGRARDKPEPEGHPACRNYLASVTATETAHCTWTTMRPSASMQACSVSIDKRQNLMPAKLAPQHKH